MQVSGQRHVPVALCSKKNTGTYWPEGKVGPRAVLGILEKDKISCPYRDSKAGQSNL